VDNKGFVTREIDNDVLAAATESPDGPACDDVLEGRESLGLLKRLGPVGPDVEDAPAFQAGASEPALSCLYFWEFWHGDQG
jgi:hypothetical protein